MFLSVFDIFKVGIGPSSSHTTGPMVAAARFLASLDGISAHTVRVQLFGSLALTGKGHGTDRAVALGLLGCVPDTLDPDDLDGLLADLATRKSITLPGGAQAGFDPDADIVFQGDTFLPGHANALTFTALDTGSVCLDTVHTRICRNSRRN